MRNRLAAGVALSACCASFATRPATAQDNATARDKLTAGTAALLADPKTAAEVSALGRALGDPDSSVRAVAARIAGLLNRTDLAVPLQQLLAGEQDVYAGREQARALLYLNGGRGLPQAKEAAVRLGPTVGSAVLQLVARSQPEQFATLAADLLSSIPESETGMFGRLAAMAVRQTPSARARIVADFSRVASGRAWREFLDRTRDDVDAPTLKEGAASPIAAVREATIWFVVSDPNAVSTIPADLLSALSPAASVTPADEIEWMVFGRELLARRHSRAQPVDGSETIRRAWASNSTEVRALAPLPELIPAERSTLRNLIPDLQTDRRTLPSKPQRGAPRSVPGLRTFPSIAPGFLGSLLEASGCRPPSGNAFAAARIFYNADGRPRRVSTDATTLPPPCATFVTFLAMLTVAPEEEPVLEAEPQWLFLSMDPAVLSCVDEHMARRSRSSGERVSAGKINVPKKIKDVRPVYPVAMQQARVSGTVIIESTITAAGCVTNSEVLRSVQLPIDIAALQAVSGWRFTPTLLDGTPVPVVMTVTVAFILQ